MMKKTKWFTFAEVLNVYPLRAPHPNATNADNWFLSMLSDASLTLRYAGIKFNGTKIKEADVKSCIQSVMDVVFDRQHDNYLYKVIEEWNEDYTLTTYDFKAAINKVINVLNLTMPKYIPLLYQYIQNYEDPIRQLESESNAFNRFNDTPEEEQDEVDFNTTDYATNMSRSKSVSKVDSGSVVERLKEMNDKFKSIILEWSNEFDMIFLDEYQLEGF